MQEEIKSVIDNLGDRYVAIPIKQSFKKALKEEYDVSATYALLNGDTISKAIADGNDECEGFTLIDPDDTEVKATLDRMRELGEMLLPFSDNHLFHEWDSLVSMEDVIDTLKGSFLTYCRVSEELFDNN